MCIRDSLHIGVLDADAQDIEDARLTAAGGAHPEHIVVAPLDIHAVVMHEHIHDVVGPGATVKHIADDAVSYTHLSR